MSYFPMDLDDERVEENTFFRPLTQERINQTTPPRWGELMREVRVAPQPGAAQVVPEQMLPRQYQLVAPAPVDAFQQQTYAFPSQTIAYPHVPFWTGAPLPFAPHAYPQPVLPPQARQGTLEAKPKPKSKAKRRGKSKKDSGRVRDKGGLFMSKKDEKQVLKGRIAELEAALKASHAESAYLREALRVSGEELTVLRSRALVQQGLAKQSAEAEHPFRQDEIVSAFDKSPRAGPATTNAEEAFRISLNYAELKNNLRPTGFTFEVESVYPL